MKERKLNNKGFSLVELIIVIAIMVILVVVFAPQYLRFVNNSRISTDVQTAANVVTAVEANIAEGNTPFGSTSNVDRTAFASIDDLNTLPACRMTGYHFVVNGNDATGVDHVNVTDGTHTYEVYPDPDNATNGMNHPTAGLRQ